MAVLIAQYLNNFEKEKTLEQITIFNFWCIFLKLTFFLSIEITEVPKEIWYQYWGEIIYFPMTYDRLWSYISNYFCQNFEKYKLLKIPIFTLFRHPFSTRRRHCTNTILLSDLRQMIAFSLMSSITWYYLSLWPK